MGPITIRTRHHALLLPVLGALLLLALTPAGANAGWLYQETQMYNSINDLSFPTTSTGFAVGASNEIYRTDNQGSTWATQTTDISDYSSLYSVDFVNAQTGWAVGGSGNILRTIDGGQTWTHQTSDEVALLSSVSFPNALDGWIVAGGAGNVVLRTTNGGVKWDSIEIPAPAKGLWAGCFTSNLFGCVGGTDGQIYRTANGGTSWQLCSTGTTADIDDIWFLDSAYGWACGAGGTILRTTNGGVTWHKQASGVKTSVAAIRFIDRSRGRAVGSSGTILTTTDGGAHWIKRYTGTDWAFDAVAPIDADHAVVGGAYGIVYRQTPQLKTGMYRWPTASSVTYKRKKGTAKFTLWARVNVGPYYAPLVPVKLQVSKNGKSWDTVSTRTTNSDGWASKTLTVRTKRTRYYRWVVPETRDYKSRTTTRQKVVVK